LSKAAKTFPSDSSSLYKYYHKVIYTNADIIQKQIDRINSLLTENSIKRYHDVEMNLKPLLKEIVAENSIKIYQLNDLVTLYCDYDYYRGQSLFYQLIDNDENYDLVWKSFQIISEASKNDTTYISALIKLDDKIRINVELAEEMPIFIIKSVQNNPEGFLDMYLSKEDNIRNDFANRIMEYASEQLIMIFVDISEKSNNDNYRKAASELIQNIKDR